MGEIIMVILAVIIFWSGYVLGYVAGVLREREPKWIPVSEKLPENSGNYLITYCYQDEIETSEAVYVKDEEEDKWYDITDIEITLAVIAWMPLPEPYNTEREVEE